MTKLKIRLKLQGFELDVEGERQDVAIATRSISDQLATLMTPPRQIVSGSGHSTGHELIDVTPDPSPEERKSGRKRSGSGAHKANKVPVTIDFVNDPGRFGTPSRAWTLTQKAMWTLFVIAELKGVTSLQAGGIARTFNKHFRQMGQIRPGNVSRDLGRSKSKVGDVPPLAGEDTTKSPSEWFLTDEGARQVRELIAISLGAVRNAA